MWHLKFVSAPTVMKQNTSNELSNDKITYHQPFSTLSTTVFHSKSQLSLNFTLIRNLEFILQKNF